MYSKNGQTTTTQHQTTSQGTVASAQNSAVARLLPARESTTALSWVRPPVVTSTLQRTAKPTATPEAAGNKRAEALAIPLLLKAGDNRKRAAVHRPSEEAIVAGSPGRIALVAQQAEAVAVSAGEPDGRAIRDVTLVSSGGECIAVDLFGGQLCRSRPAESLLRPG